MWAIGLAIVLAAFSAVGFAVWRLSPWRGHVRPLARTYLQIRRAPVARITARPDRETIR